MRVEMDVRHLETILADLYGEDRASDLLPRVAAILAQHPPIPDTSSRWDERDAWLIAYPDQFRSDDRSPLATLHDFYVDHAIPAFNGIHVLPFFPSTSDEGFSISDYSSVSAEFGTWSDIETIGRDSRLMIDAVINHCSAGSMCFEQWRDDVPEFRDFFRTVAPGADVSRTVRAREHPLLTPYTTAHGREWVWTTFSPDQVDLNYGNPDVLLYILSMLLSYAAHGASALRIDAACFLWKEEGTTSIHLPQTHRIIQFIRACLNLTYPDVIVVSETNVPHAENVSYLGDGTVPEADMVYRFTLPPLVLHTFSTGVATDLGAWLSSVEPTPPNTTFLNFLASHDGVGLRPLEGLVDDASVERLVEEAEAHGGRVNRRTRSDTTSAPYELNGTWYDLVRGPTSDDDAMARHLASHAIMFAISGVPAVYVHALLATENDLDLVAETGAARSINRSRLDLATLDALLADPSDRASFSLAQINSMLRLRKSSDAFHPDSTQTILETPQSVLGIERCSASGATARVYVNVSGDAIDVTHRFPAPAVGYRCESTSGGLHLEPWGFAWLIAQG